MRVLALVFLLAGCSISTPKPTTVLSLSGANALVGLHEKSDREFLKSLMGIDPVRYEWCAAFVNAILSRNGIPGSESVSDNPLLARSFLAWGTPVTSPKRGDIVIFPRGDESWQGHVGFYKGKVYRDGVLYYIILGGNQSNIISYEFYPAKSALGIRRWIVKE
jgi:uncharacterized protein (TIGR02594 family)